MKDLQAYIEKEKAFRQMHMSSSTFVLPNAWDVASSKILASCGFKAIGTTSAGIAASLGYKDGQKISRKEMLESVAGIANSVPIPISVDLEAGYGKTIPEVLKTVHQAISVGCVGINLEDGVVDDKKAIYPLNLQVEKIVAIKELARSLKIPIFVNARIDLFWRLIGHEKERLQATMERAKAYREAGADCIFIPGVEDEKTIQRLRKGIASPINLLAGPGTPSIATLSQIGINRLSCGSGLFRVVYAKLNEVGTDIMQGESVAQSLQTPLSYKEMANMMKN
ncbi:isocitrate lyase/phosphoenolpyruvate mutase family protein [Oceanobacillus sp. CFH 90083]|uniref:isocitrate lyase/PEP mutase family protein n=1 Tax=Oceanobacillus sp. CFH 90083 TaxID=2592336 RepID=UPI00128AE1DA|nr:isocitrate lyase/phosphoenolpyruvate mutase family protein [Oceanobacillus sp. CFH 90083]